MRRPLIGRGDRGGLVGALVVGLIEVDAGDRRAGDVHRPVRASPALLPRRIGSEVGPPTVNSRAVAPGTPRPGRGGLRIDDQMLGVSSIAGLRVLPIGWACSAGSAIRLT